MHITDAKNEEEAVMIAALLSTAVVNITWNQIQKYRLQMFCVNRLLAHF